MSDFKKRPIKDIVNEFKRLGDFATRNHYAVIGIQDFSIYDDSFKQVRENEINLEFPVNVHPDDNNIARKMLNQAAAALKDPKKKQEFDTKFRQYLSEEVPKADIRLGKPVLVVEENGVILPKSGGKDEGKIVFTELKLDYNYSKNIIVKNGSGGILRGVISTPPNLTWINVNPNKFDQSDLPLPVSISIATNSNEFNLEEVRFVKLLFSYATDTERVEESRTVQISTEGLEKKIQRLSKYSIWIFVALYTILVGVQTFNNIGTSFFSIKITFLYKVLIWASIPILYLFLKDYNLFGFEKMKDIFNRETFREKFELSILGLLLFFSFELFILFVVGIGVLWLNKQVLKTMKVKNGTFYTPFVGLLLYAILLTQLPSYLQKYTTQQPDPQSASTYSQPTTDVYIRILKDSPVRTTASIKGTVAFVAKAGGTYKLVSNQLINNEWAQVKYPKNSVEQIGYIRFSNETIQVISN